METKYWLTRQRSSVRMASAARSSRARLVHYELAGMYGLKASEAAGATRLAGRLSASRIIASAKPEGAPSATSDQFYYACLEQGANYLAAQAGDPAEREAHLRAGAAYAARAEDAAAAGPALRFH